MTTGKTNIKRGSMGTSEQRSLLKASTVYFSWVSDLSQSLGLFTHLKTYRALASTNNPDNLVHSIIMAVPTSDGPKVIPLTDEERDSGVMSDKKLYDAIEAFFTDGLVVVENAIDVQLIDRLNERMLKDTESLLSGGGKVHFK